MRTNIRIFAILLLSLVTGCLYADNLYIEEVNIYSGKTMQVGISLQNASSNYTALQFDMILPDGVSMAKDELGELKASLNVDGRDHRFRVAEVSTNKYRFLVYSMTNSELVVSDSPLIFFTIETVGGINYDSKAGSLKDALLVQKNGKSNVVKDTSFSVTVKEFPVVTIVANSSERPYGDANPQFDFKTEGGELNGTPEITCEADVTSPVGTYDITVRQGSVSNEKVTYVNGKLTIIKAPLTITAKSYTIKQGEALPTFEAEYSGFKNNETESVLTTKPTLATTATSASEPGTYEITVNGADAQNYELSYTNGKLIITEADPVTITAKSFTREYGEDNPTFEYTSKGATLVGTPEITCEATANSPVGTYPIVIKKGSVTNYNTTYVNGTLTITKAPLTAKVENATREQYVENPEFMITYSGWKLNEDESVLTKKPTATTTATKDSPVGTYDIVVSGGEAQNYELKYQNGVLTVTESTRISEVSVKDPADVYTLQGYKVLTKAMTLEGLPKGVYIVNGKKVVVK